MQTDPLAFLEQDLPPHFARGVDALRAAGGPGAAEALADVLGSAGAVRVIVEGAGEAWVAVEGGAMRCGRERPGALPVRAAIELGEEPARKALEMLAESGRFDDPEAPARFARVASVRAEKLIAGQRIEFHVVLTDLPDDADDVVVKVAIGADAPPAKPQFTARISYDDLEDLRAGDLTPQQVLGRLRLSGDASRAMALGMSLFSPPKPGAPPAKK